jgi:hypothetical protein
MAADYGAVPCTRVVDGNDKSLALVNEVIDQSNHGARPDVYPPGPPVVDDGSWRITSATRRAAFRCNCDADYSGIKRFRLAAVWDLTMRPTRTSDEVICVEERPGRQIETIGHD